MRLTSIFRSMGRKSAYRVLLALLIVSSAVCAQVRSVNDGDLSLRIIPNTNSVHLNDTLLMKVEVMNIGNDPVYLRADDLCLNPGAGLTMSVSDSSGKTLKTSVPLTCVAIADVPDRDGLVRLAPDAFFGRLIRIQPSRISPKPGRYALTFSLRGTLSTRQLSQILNPGRAPIRAFTSESSSLHFQLPLDITP